MLQFKSPRRKRYSIDGSDSLCRRVGYGRCLMDGTIFDADRSTLSIFRLSLILFGDQMTLAYSILGRTKDVKSVRNVFVSIWRKLLRIIPVTCFALLVLCWMWSLNVKLTSNSTPRSFSPADELITCPPIPYIVWLFFLLICTILLLEWLVNYYDTVVNWSLRFVLFCFVSVVLNCTQLHQQRPPRWQTKAWGSQGAFCGSIS